MSYLTKESKPYNIYLDTILRLAKGNYVTDKASQQQRVDSLIACNLVQKGNRRRTYKKIKHPTENLNSQLTFSLGYTKANKLIWKDD